MTGLKSVMHSAANNNHHTLKLHSCVTHTVYHAWVVQEHDGAELTGPLPGMCYDQCHYVLGHPESQLPVRPQHSRVLVLGLEVRAVCLGLYVGYAPQTQGQQAARAHQPDAAMAG